MIGVVVVAHGNLAQALLEASEFIVGKQEKIQAVSVDASEDVKAASERIRKAMKAVSDDGTLLLTDILGGTPAKIGMMFLDDGKVEVVTGVNLPMLIKLAYIRTNNNLTEVAKILMEYGRETISVASTILYNRKK